MSLEIELTKFKEYCRSMAPLEAGGYMDAAGMFQPLPNVHISPENGFFFHYVPDDATMILHSHPGGPFAPSEGDQIQQIAYDIPWAIYAFDGDREEYFVWPDDQPLVGRGFRHFVSDCYSAIKDGYRVLYGVELPEFVREWEWWNKGKSLYTDGFAKAGFHEVPFEEALPGDVLLMLVRSQVVNHAAIMIGGGLIFHHVSGKTESDPAKLSTVESVGRWLPYITAVLRHENGAIARTPFETVRSKLRIGHI